MTPDRAPAAIARGIPSAHKKTGRLMPAGSKPVAMAKGLGDLDVRSLLAAAALVVLDHEGDFVAFVQRRNA